MSFRIAIVGLPRMLEQIVTALLDREEDFEVVEHDAAAAGLSERVESARADVVILGQPNSDTPQSVDRLMKRLPRLKVFTLTPNGRDAFRVELKPTRVPLDEISSESLVAEIRRSLAENGGPHRSAEAG